jgi:hypothetical protein
MNPLKSGFIIFLVIAALIVLIGNIAVGFQDYGKPVDPYFWPNTYSHWYAGFRGKAERGLPYMP